MSNSPWAPLVYSIRRRRSPGARFFKPVCLIAAIDLADEDRLDPARLDAEAIISRFKSYVSLVFESRAEMGWKPLWHLSNDGLWKFYSAGVELSSKIFREDRPPGTKAILFKNFDQLTISSPYFDLWKEEAERTALRKAMLDILATDDKDCRRFARQLFHAELAMQPERWPSEEEVERALLPSREQLDLFGEGATDQSENATGERSQVTSSIEPVELAAPAQNAPLLVVPPTVKEIEEVASPTARLNSTSEIDLAANPRIDSSDSAASVGGIPEIQIVQIGVILESLPGNAPRGMTAALTAYRTELEKRGARPILGILTNQFAIIDAEYQSSDAVDWLPLGMKAAFSDFLKYHHLLLLHFPFLAERESVIARIDVDENKATGEVLIKPFRAALNMAMAAKNAGVATSDVVQFMQELKQGAETIAALPNEVAIPDADIKNRNISVPTPKQRLIGTAIGFLERAYNLLGASVGIGTAAYPTFSQNLANVLEMLKSLMHIR